MKRCSVALCSVALAVLAAVPATAELSPREVKKNLKLADKAWEAGQVETAVALYESVLDATEPGAAERADALYAVAVVTMAGEDRDAERAGQLVAELVESFPRHPRRLEVRLMQALAEARGESARLARELDARQAALAEERRKASGASQARKAEAQEMRAQLTRSEEELEALHELLETTQSALAKKDKELAEKKKELAETEEKLEKVRATLGGGG